MLTSFPLITRQQSPLIVRALHAFDVFKYPAAWSHINEAGKLREGGKGRTKRVIGCALKLCTTPVTCRISGCESISSEREETLEFCITTYLQYNVTCFQR